MRNLVAVGMVVFGLVAVAQALADEIKDGRGFSMKYPEGWQLASPERLKRTGLKSDRTVGVVLKDEEGKFPAKMIITVRPHVADQPAETGRAAVISAFCHEEHEIQKAKTELRQIGGRACTSLAFQIEVPSWNANLRAWQVVVPGTQWDYVIYCLALESAWADCFRTFKESVYSLTTPDSGEKPTGATPADSSEPTDSPAKLVKGAKLSPQEVEEQALKLLSAGKQWEAQDLLAQSVNTLTEARQALGLLLKKQQAEAAAALGKRADFHRKWQRVIFLYAACIRSRFEVPESLPVFAMTIMIDGASTVGQASVCLCLLDADPKVRKNPEETFAKFRKLADANPDDIVIRWMLAVQCRTYDRNEEGVEHYKKILEKWKPGPVLVHQTYANLLDHVNRFEEALVERRIAVEMEPAAWSINGLASTLDNLKRFDEAYKARAEVIRREPDQSGYWSNWANTCNRMHRFDEAIAKANRALELDPRNDQASQALKLAREAKATGIANLGDTFNMEQVQKGVGHMQKREWAKANAEFTEAIRLDPKSAALFVFRGEAYRMNGEVDKSVADANEAIRLDPKFARAYFVRGWGHKVKNEFDQAIADLSESIRLDPKSTEAYVTRAIVYSYKNDAEKVFADAAEVIRLDPTLAEGYTYRAWAYDAKKEFDKAIADCNEAIRRDPKHAFAYTLRADCYKEKGDKAKAEADEAEAKRIEAANRGRP